MPAGLYEVYLSPKRANLALSVSRLVAQSEGHGMHLALDFNTELYPLTVGARFTFALASSLSRVVDTEDSDVRNVWRPDDKGRAGIEKDYDYVMYGKVSLLRSLLSYKC